MVSPEMHYICFEIDKIGVEPKENYEKKEIPDNCHMKMEYTVMEQNGNIDK